MNTLKNRMYFECISNVLTLMNVFFSMLVNQTGTAQTQSAHLNAYAKMNTVGKAHIAMNVSVNMSFYKAPFYLCF